ncbi:MG2 domain-containing protein [Flavobacterium psychrotrophum]|uniref:alpha-2-macroglobulin family protein n=1 Tax=Flavobacterium psychrotrophum TaxID=2294119 RepID=UPI000E313034|nr:MG2 domain-containing protein [Flavobacterium psychrotrophum]
MKKNILLFCCLFIFSNAIAQDYDTLWEKVIAFEAEGLIKSAAAQTDTIYLKAKKSDNEAQLLKAFFFRSRYMQTLEEDAQLRIIEDIRAEMKTVSPPTKAFMQSLYAEMLNDVYNRNSSTINNHADVTDTETAAITLWGSNNFKAAIIKAYKKSLEPKELLYKTPLSVYNEILDVSPMAPDRDRPLYDFLAERYINEYKPYEKDYKEMPKEIAKMLLGTYGVFQKISIPDSVAFTKDPIYNKLQLLQNIEKWYALKKDTLSLQRAIMRRLAFVYVSFPSALNKEQVYMDTLQELIKQWKDSPYAYRAKAELARMYVQTATKTLHPEYNDKALQLCNDIIAHLRVNDVATRAQVLKNKLVNRTLAIFANSSALPGKPQLARVTYKNINFVQLDVFKLIYTKAQEFPKVIPKSYADSLTAGKQLLKKIEYILPERHDHFEYSTEVIIPGLAAGAYLVRAVDDKGVALGYELLTISGINMATVEIQDDNNACQILNAETGAPIVNAVVTIDGKKVKLDSEGRFMYKPEKVKKIPNHPTNNVLVAVAGDTLIDHFRKYALYYKDTKAEDDEEFPVAAKLFTDRAIYRPGQTVYFKGIIYQKRKQKLSTVPNLYVSVVINDSHYNELKSFRLKTNEFGSFTGSYTLPTNVMTGEFMIELDEDNEMETDPAYNKRHDEHPFWDYADFDFDDVSFRVEEYKRPTFDVSFEPVTDDTRLGEKATLTGVAKSFSGVPVSGATVTYKITRTGVWSGNGYSYTEIGKGTAVTDAEGKFALKFTALADQAAAPAKMPVFTFNANAEVTDINGETHSAEGSMRVGYHSLMLTAAITPEVNPKNKNVLTLNSTNLNGAFNPAKGTVNIYKVVPKKGPYLNRPWPSPEIQTIPQDEFEKAFPYYPYSSEQKDTVVYSGKVFEKEINTDEAKELTLTDFRAWQSGLYEVVYTARDSAGYKVETKRQFTLKRDDDKAAPDNLLFESRVADYKISGNNSYAILEFRSTFPLYINISTLDKKSVFFKTVQIKDGLITVKVPVTLVQDHFTYQVDYIWQNTFEHKAPYTYIDRSLKGLEVETQTLTDKLKPGKSETWSFTIKGGKMPAEVLASMYDASLDKFTKADWEFNTDNDNIFSDYEKDKNDYIDLSSRRLARNDRLSINYNNNYGYVNQGFFDYEQRLNTFGFNINKSDNIYAKIEVGNVVYANGLSVVTGIVTDSNGMPLPGVSVVTDKKLGAISDFDGNYRIAAAKGSKLYFSFIGFTSADAVVDGKILNIALAENSGHLDEVVVIGYGTTHAQSFGAGGDIITVTSKTLEGRPNASFIQMLQGQVPGLNMQRMSTTGSVTTVVLRGAASINGVAEPLFIIDGVPVSGEQFRKMNPNDISSVTVLKDAAATSIYGNRGANGVVLINTQNAQKELEALKQVESRKSFNETAFFYPQLKTDKKGNISFTFTTPESLTEWKLRLLAHNKNVLSGYFQGTFVTQKDLMVVPNMPRFLREKDTVVVSAKITNLTPEAKNGSALLQLFDAATMQPLDEQMINIQPVVPFALAPKGSSIVSWTFTVPVGIQGVQYKIVAKAGDFSDGEENILPVLNNTILITESVPLWVKSGETKTYTLQNLKDAAPSVKHQLLSLEYTTNTAWVALKSLPYLTEFEYECSEQVFARFYANSIAKHILDSNPRISEVFNSWREKGANLNKLAQNAELKSIVLEETPWLLEGKTTEEQNNRLATLFEMDKLSSGLAANLNKLRDRQMPSGGFPWFEGGKEDAFITRHIVAGLGHLEKLGVLQKSDSESVALITKKAINYLDADFLDGYKNLKKQKEYKITTHTNELHYLYMRSFYGTTLKPGDTLAKVAELYVAEAKTHWKDYPLYEKAMLALVVSRSGDSIMASKIIASLKETSANNTEWGMYWIANTPGYYWYHAQVETQAVLMEAFSEIANDTQSIDAMKVWLIKQKQTHNWATTKATTEAVYALMMQGSNWLAEKESTVMKLGNSEKNISDKMGAVEKEAATGYMKLRWQSQEIKNELAQLTITNNGKVPGYGGFYWQYFEDADAVKPLPDGAINITRQLYLKTTGDAPLQPVNENTVVKVGNKLTVRLIITVKEDLEYVHVKDLRAAALEPADVLSSYHYLNDAGYYKSTRDAATHFFFAKLPRGTYILEYDVTANTAGNYSNGLSTAQSMYAPEYGAHGKGSRITID